MEKITIRLEEKDGTARIKEPVGLGIPLPKGGVQAIHQLALMNGQEPINVQLEPLAHWPDGSLRWVHASFLVSLGSGQVKDLELAKPQKLKATTSHESAIEQTSDGCVIRTSTGSVVLVSNSLSWQVTQQNNPDKSSTVTLSDEAGLPCTDKADASWEITHKGSVFVAATLNGQWLKQNNEPLALFECELRIFLETGFIQVGLTTHNPKRVRHPGGLWDLGDAGSVYFRELAIETTLPAKCLAQVTPQATDKEPKVVQLADFNLYQDSSGGGNWQSRNHVDANGEITTQFCGYRLANPNDLVREGKRANPLISIEHDGGTLDLAVPGFWQNFPTSLRKEDNKLTVGLFPKDFKKTYELQGGERKTLRCVMAHSSNSNTVAAAAYSPLMPVLAPECYEQANAFPWFKANAQPDALGELIAEGLSGNSNFFAKREVIDEFGWRNFGDIFADHETLYQAEGDAPFISHYNNQYDAIFGFARQFAVSGDKRWFELMDDLAKHVTDIDIYHTNQDRGEYNNGLFWHTDHYLEAQTATHRTFTRHNDTSSTPGQTGGGPAAEHCYTTGLMYHYLLTGIKASKTAALELAQWMVTNHEGSSGLLESVLALKNRELPRMKALAKGNLVTTHIYPFTRGTGNYLTALVDASILEPENDWLTRAEAVIKNTIHPEDNITNRDLLNIETGWSYLILLSAIARYLQEKRARNQLDEPYQFAAASLLAYANWMQQNERPFLADTAQLEFANHTWVAQDIRKAMLIFQAAELVSQPKAASLMNTAQDWLKQVCDTLKGSEERHYSRILVILMQNYGPHLAAIPANRNAALTNPELIGSKTLKLTWRELIGRIAGRMVYSIKRLNIAKEKAWLDTRRGRK
ncbi:hypothetical protein [Marinobacter psychrophilus]|jgi:hypothetical protein|uniref:RIFT barrel domain-containing protein n=1 Tax=Marinobacter psychrophilus TaxID=330734 RepID=UPI001B527F81|nr:hypothetical protein [Marinobacter psychrophilus]MBQ0762759.1 hypothetical protein [Marinobacter psychrophilus]MBQ0844479.1 hypothetical protein [Marinobacter psychrophilus]